MDVYENARNRGCRIHLQGDRLTFPLYRIFGIVGELLVDEIGFRVERVFPQVVLGAGGVPGRAAGGQANGA